MYCLCLLSSSDPHQPPPTLAGPAPVEYLMYWPNLMQARISSQMHNQRKSMCQARPYSKQKRSAVKGQGSTFSLTATDPIEMLSSKRIEAVLCHPDVPHPGPHLALVGCMLQTFCIQSEIIFPSLNPSPSITNKTVPEDPLLRLGE